ncbi:hypothetical protein QA584_01190 [Anaerocolumna sp. AGMB13025]|uniref:hypothetical protein n=1 Tax=Anaerocolumna sp. AGMB13025 TaxID=3039116 RepID=UPI00241FD52D|nr:hypothetical protein [Anaerocolumna sp. AGMB13025]WFR57724.1 hypothetical protein QA584_01190 [Anaerocolumna sp. AGMB13025]
MKKLVALLVGVLLLLSYPNFVYADDYDVQQEVQSAADKGVEFAKDKFSKDPEKWGFNKDDDISRITLGNGYRLRYLDKDKLMNSNSSKLMDVTIESDFWLYIIYLNDAPKTYMTVGLLDGEYKIVQLGGKAQGLDATINNFNQLTAKTEKNSKPIVAKIQNNYFLISQASDNSNEQVLPLISAESANNFSNVNNTEFVNSEEIIKALKESNQDSMEGNQYGVSYGVSDTKTSINEGNSLIKVIISISILLIAGFSVTLYHRKSNQLHNE